MKNINRILEFGLIVVFMACISSCKKDDSSAPEPTIAINIQSPTEGTVLQHGDTLRINATVTSPVQLHGYEWTLRNKSDNTELARGGDHVHELNFSITGEYINNVTDTTDAELEIVTEVDHDGNETTQKVNVTLYP